MTENQISEMFRMMTTVVTKIQVIESDIKSLKTGQDELREDVGSLKVGQDKLREGQEKLRKDFDEFRAETKANFTEVKRELKLMNRKVNILTEDVVEVRAETEDLIVRVEKIEERRTA